MSAELLKTWMDRKGLNAVDIASLLKIHPDTVERYLKGKPARRSTVAAFQRLVASKSADTAKRRSLGI